MLLILIQRTRHSVRYPCQITSQGPHTQSGILAKSEDKVQATEFPAISSAQPSNTGTKGEVATSKMCPLIRIFITRKFNSCLRLSWLFCCCQKHCDCCMTQVSPPGESAEQRENTPSWKPPKMSEMKHSHHMAGWLLHARRHTHTHTRTCTHNVMPMLFFCDLLNMKSLTLGMCVICFHKTDGNEKKSHYTQLKIQIHK